MNGAKSIKGIEHRAFERHNYMARVLLLIKTFDISYNMEKSYYIEARMYNYSRQGMYIETEYPLQPGTQVYIKLATSSTACRPESLKGYHGKVRWCRTISASSPCYGVGIQYSSDLEIPAFGFTGDDLLQEGVVTESREQNLI